MPAEYRITDPNQLAVVLRSFRRARKLTQAKLAERLGVVQQSYARMETHPAATSVSSLMKMLAALGVDLVLRDRTPTDKAEQAANAQIKETPSISQQSQGSSAKSKESTDSPFKKPARRLNAASGTTKIQGGDAQIRTGKILPLTSKKGW